IDTSWNVKTKTSLSYHRWIDKPKLMIGGVSLPIETIANLAISKSQSLIEDQIDASVNENFTLRQKMIETMKLFEQPMQMDPKVNAWLNITPEKFEINKVINSRFTAKGKIGIQGTSTFSTYKPSVSPNIALPKVYWNEEIPDSSVFRLITDIKMEDINPMLKQNLDGKTFSTGDRSITLSNIITNCDYEYLRVITDVSGAVNGMLIIKGRPKYDAFNNGFYMDNIDIQLKTKNVIHKAAAWIAEGKIRSEMENNLKFSIDDTMKDVQKNIDTYLKDFNKMYDLEMKIGLGKSDVETFQLKPGQIETLFNTKFYLELLIKDFRSFNKF
ncbi:MAG: DUF4403 family protein, partial [Saprospiraceae bacterium]